VTMVAANGMAATTTADAWNVGSPVGQVNVALDSGSATVSFRVSSPPLPANVKLWADATGANASFAGDYKRAGVTALDFNLASSSAGAPITWVTLMGASGRRWVKPGAVLGHNSVSFDRTGGGWLLATDGNESDAAWLEDLRDVAGLGLQVIRDQKNLAAHNVTVSGFQLSGSQTVGAAEPTLADVLMARFGVSSIADLIPALPGRMMTAMA
jgi:hypothetical protein